MFWEVECARHVRGADGRSVSFGSRIRERPDNLCIRRRRQSAWWRFDPSIIGYWEFLPVSSSSRRNIRDQAFGVGCYSKRHELDTTGTCASEWKEIGWLSVLDGRLVRKERYLRASVPMYLFILLEWLGDSGITYLGASDFGFREAEVSEWH